MAASVLSKGARQQQALNPFVLKLKSFLMQDCADWKSELGGKDLILRGGGFAAPPWRGRYRHRTSDEAGPGSRGNAIRQAPPGRWRLRSRQGAQPVTG